jgi:hypothetical protein
MQAGRLSKGGKNNEVFVVMGPTKRTTVAGIQQNINNRQQRV